MSKGKIHHSVKNKLWIKPEIVYDTWLNLKNYGRAHDLDFPSVVDLAASLILDPKANEIATSKRVDICEVYHTAIDLYYRKMSAIDGDSSLETIEAVSWGHNE